MTVTITLAPEIEAQVAALATAEGYALEDYLPRLIQYALPRPLAPLQQGSPKWLNLLFQVPSSTENGSSTISREDLRRENLYNDRT